MNDSRNQWSWNWQLLPPYRRGVGLHRDHRAVTRGILLRGARRGGRGTRHGQQRRQQRGESHTGPKLSGRQIKCSRFRILHVNRFRILSCAAMVQEAPLKIYARGVVSYFYFSRAPRARALKIRQINSAILKVPDAIGDGALNS
jgi:hypothetical protein